MNKWIRQIHRWVSIAFTLGALLLLQAIAYDGRGERADAQRCGLVAMQHLPRGGARWVAPSRPRP